MDNAFLMVYVRFYIKQIKDSKSLSELPDDTLYDFSDTNKNRKKIKYKNKYFSKGEIMGLVVMRQTKDNRSILVIDDSTGVIEATIWHKSPYYSEGISNIKNSQYVKIIGTFDYFYDRKGFEIEKITIVEDLEKEYTFHKLLYESHQRIFSVNLKENFEAKNSKFLDKSSSEYNKKKKEFSNKLLVFFLLYDVKNQDLVDKNYVTITVEDLFSYENFFFMVKDFVNKNNIDNIDMFLKDVFCFLQEKNLLQMKSESKDLYNYLKHSTLTVKASNPELEKTILSCFVPENNERFRTVSYTEIFDRQSKMFLNYYTGEYIRNFLKYLCEKRFLIEVCQNTYALNDFFC